MVQSEPLLLDPSIAQNIRRPKPMLNLIQTPSLILFCIAGLFQPFVYVTYTYLYGNQVLLL